MKALLSIVIAFASLALVVEDTEARRIGGGRSIGTQRSAPAPQKAAPAPAQQQQQQAAPAAPAQQPQPVGASKWLGPLAGLALGAGLAALFLNNGLGGLLAGLLVIGLLAAALVFAARWLMRGRTETEPLQYAGAGAGSAGRSVTPLPGGPGAQSLAAAAGRWPDGFNEAEFIRHARLNFVRLQQAHDRKDLSTLRDFLAPEVYREIESDIRAAGDAPETTEVLTLDAEVLDVAEEGGAYVVSVRFSGMIREAAGRDAEPFSETWHLVKPLRGNSGWQVAGIQQA
jgi:predicted lipid-binding transport protein (Tim44 family)